MTSLLATPDPDRRKIDELIAGLRLNDRLGAALHDALTGLRVTRPSYV